VAGPSDEWDDEAAIPESTSSAGLTCGFGIGSISNWGWLACGVGFDGWRGRSEYIMSLHATQVCRPWSAALADAA
jgi:hypothetical protein